MKTDHLLNTLILALSVATILITLISYLIFKVRQFSVKKNIHSEIKKEGVFFRRLVVSEPTDKSIKDQKIKRSIIPTKNKLLIYFGIVFLIVFISLFSRDFVANKFARYDRAQEAKNILELRELGLHNSYTLDRFSSQSPLEEMILPSQKDFLDQKLNFLRTKRIALINYKRPSQQLALGHWKNFFKESNISVSIIENTNDLSFDLYILPQSKILNNSQITELEKLLKAKKNILVTGPTGLLNGLEQTRELPWLTEKFGIEIKHIGLDHLAHPVIFRDHGTLGLSTPPGLKLDWRPLSDDYQYLVDKDLPFSIETDFNGKTISIEEKISARGLLRENEKSKYAWLSLDPFFQKSWSKADVFYGSTIITDLLYHMTGLPSVKIADWRDGKDWAITISSDCEEKIEGSYHIWRILKSQNLPGTFFIVTDLLKSDNRLTDISSTLFEAASHTESHRSLPDLELEEQFDEIQNSRLIIENRTRKPVLGFHPPMEKFDEKALSVAAQNHLSYFVGDQRLFRMAPLRLTNNLNYFPRIFADDFIIAKNKNLISDEVIVEFLMSDARIAENFGGLYYLNLHSQVMGQPLYHETLDKLFTSLNKMENSWKATFGEIDHWSRQRAAIELTLQEGKITIRNPLKETINGVVLKINGQPNSLGNLLPNEIKSIKLVNLKKSAK